MAKVTTSRANKDYPAAGIKKGDTYYSWAFFRGPTMRSATYPRPSQLVGSEKKSNALAVYEDLEDALAAATTPEDIKAALDQAAEEAQNSIDEYDESISNMEEAFSGGSPAIEEAEQDRDNIQSFLDECESASSEVENLDYVDYEVKPDQDPEKGEVGWDNLTEDGQSEMLQAARELAESVSLDL